MATFNNLSLEKFWILMEFFKYPTIINDDVFRSKFGYQPKVKTVQSLKNLGMPSERKKLITVSNLDESV